ncbi:MAG: hypothetical protein KAR21_05860 [Spirochaetales bacterium]|nr:hypothetical protein [Spirochaetales bacterium]
MKKIRKYLTVGRIFGETFNLYFNNFFLLCFPYVVVIFPFGLLNLIIRQGLTSEGFSVIGAILTVISYLLGFAVSFYVIILAANVYIDKKENRSTILRKISGRIFLFAVLNFVVLFGFALGFVLLLVPGILFITGMAVADIVFVVEKKGIKKSLKRSWALTKGYKGTIFLSSLLFYILMIGISFGLSAIMGVNSNGLGSFVDILANMSERSLNLRSVISLLFNNIIAPTYTCISVVIFFNLLKEREGFETEHLADSFLENTNDDLQNEDNPGL